MDNNAKPKPGTSTTPQLTATQPGADGSSLTKQVSMLSGGSTYEVEERPYASHPFFTKNASCLKHRWEQAPRGKVFFLSRDQTFGQMNSPSPSPRGGDGGGGGSGDESQPLVYGTDYESKDTMESHYTPGVQEHSLDELRATSIAGNDISSSCLYATGIVARAAGIYSPFSSSLVCIVLYFFRKIYSEVFSALPMNGGTYNALLNTSNKNMAALAAVLSTISYTATAVTSAASAGDYLNYQWPAVPSEWVCLGILIFFALLTLMGIKDSANTATVLFIAHLSVMASLVIGSLVYVIKDGGETLKGSWNSTSPRANPHGNIALNLFFGYCSALLGVTGFESSSNYIEEQKEGVFPKTLRNMWISITLINPALAVLAMGVVDIDILAGETTSTYSLAAVAEVAFGPWFRTIVVIDAALVLSGAVLTSYVGITGLHRRLALDRIMPHFFLNVNEWRKSNHWIIIVFCCLTCSLRLLVSDMDVLGGVYAIAFLGVMTLFCVSNFLLKLKRARLPRNPIAHPLIVFIAMTMVILGIGGNMAKDPVNAEWFLMYFAVFGVAVLATKLRVTLLRFLVRLVPSKYQAFRDRVEQMVHELRSFPVVFFVKEANLHVMNKAIHYIVQNEDTKSIKIVHMESIKEDDGKAISALDSEPSSPPRIPEVVVESPGHHTYRGDDAFLHQNTTAPNREDLNEPSMKAFRRSRTRKQLEEWCTILDELYPKITIDILFVDQEFGPDSVHMLSQQLGIPKNYMFMTCPSERFNHTIGHLGGVRVIQH